MIAASFWRRFRRARRRSAPTCSAAAGVRSAIEGRTSIATVTRDGRPRLELAYAIERRTALDQRFSAALVDAFVGGYLRRIREAGANEAYVVDETGDVIGSAGSESAAPRALSPSGDHGRMKRDGVNLVYAAAPVPSTDLRVVLVKPDRGGHITVSAAADGSGAFSVAVTDDGRGSRPKTSGACGGPCSSSRAGGARRYDGNRPGARTRQAHRRGAGRRRRGRHRARSGLDVLRRAPHAGRALRRVRGRADHRRVRVRRSGCSARRPTVSVSPTAC